ncbi:MAG: hypothetical protein AAB404_03170 [Patescibacteria group bacterium]
MKTKQNNKNYISFILIAGALLMPAIFVAAQTTDSTSSANSAISENETMALQDLSQLTGQQIISVVQAREICNLEKFMADCADIGKKRNLYDPEEIKQVNAVLVELKGKIIEDLKNCVDENCLFKVANQLAQSVTKNNPGLAKQTDLTTKAIEGKKEIINAAQEAGVNFGNCQAMDPDTAPIELLRACAKLAKDTRVQKHISADKKQIIESIDSTVQFRESLARGDYQCGDGTLEGCGNFCLKPTTEAKEKGVSAIPSVCRDIANKFFGPDGIKQLETNYGQVSQAVDFYQKKNENSTFVTLDGKVLFNPEEIGLYLETEAKNGNIEAIEKGTSFLVAQGLINSKEKEFALKMTRTAKAQGGISDFDICRKDPKACAKFIPEEEKGQFEINEKINSIMISEMSKEGVSDPRLCENSQYNEKCLRASKQALPQLEALAVNSPEIKIMIQGIKTHIEFGQNGFEAKERARKESEKFGGKFIIGDNEFQNFEEMDDYCRADNGQECLADAAKKGFIEKDFAAIKFGRMYEKQFVAPEFNQQFFQPTGDMTTEFPFPTPTNVPQYQSQNQNRFPANPTNVFTPQGSDFQATSKINKEEALKLFQAWLDNPEGQPPIPYLNNPQVSYPGAFPGYQQPPTSSPYDYNYPYHQQLVCPQVFPQPCPFGQYRRVSTDPNNCPNYGECVSAPVYQPPVKTGNVICPSLPTVDSCPTGQIKEMTFSSPECGVYYGCKNTNVETPVVCNSGQYWNGTACVTSTTASNWTNHNWTFKDGQAQSSSILSRTDQEYSNFISGIDAQCRLINKNQFFWKPNAGDGAAENWQNFGIPDCQGITTQTTCTSGQYWNGTACVSSTTTSCGSGQYWNGTACVDSTTTTPSTSCSENLKSILGYGCHFMNNAYFDGPMTRYVLPNASTAKDCSAEYIDGCSTGASQTTACSENLKLLLGYGCHLMNNVYFDGPMIKYVLPNTSTVKDCTVEYINSCPTGATSQTCPNGQYWFVPSNGSGYCKLSETTITSCGSGQYWNGTACVTSTTASNWTNHNWTFKDGQAQSSSILSRTDQEYSNFISGIDAQCRLINKNQFFWKPNAGDGAAENWQNFGIPDCQGITTQTTCTSGQYWNGTACVSSTTTSCGSGQYWNGTACIPSSTPTASSTNYSDCNENLKSLLGFDCHLMGSNYFNGPMTKYVLSNTSTVKECSAEYIDSCSVGATCPNGQYWSGTACVISTTTSCGSGQYWNGTACVSSTTTACTGSQYWNGAACVASPSTSCTSSQYWNGTACVDSSSSCGSGQYWDGYTNTCVTNPSTSCGSWQYWNGTACVSSTTTACTGSQYWNGTACVDSPSSSCTSGQYWNGTACVSSTTTACTGSQYWNGTACVDSPSSSCGSGQYWNGTACVTSSISLEYQLAQIMTILRKMLELSNLIR